MNSAKTATVFFAMAFALAVLWGLVEFLLQKETPAASVRRCEVSGGTSLAQRHFLQRTDARLWLYDASKETLEQQTLSLEFQNLSWRSERQVPLRCVQPGYHCFLNKDSGGAESLQPMLLTESFGLVKVTGKKIGSIVPLEIGENTLRLGTALKMCGKPPALRKEAWMKLGSSLFYFDKEQGRLGQWRMSQMEGFATRSVAREPDLVFRIDAEHGLIPSPCDEKAPLVPAEISGFQSHLALLHDFATGTRLRVYRFEDMTGLAPDEFFPFSPTNIQSMASLQEKGFLTESVNGALSRWSWLPSKGSYNSQDLAASPSFALKTFRQGPSDLLFMSGQNRAFSRQSIWVYLNGEWRFIKNRAWKFYRERAADFEAVATHPYRGVLIFNEGADIDLIPYDCAGS